MKEVWEYIVSDYYRYYGKVDVALLILFTVFFRRNHCFRYSFWLRLSSRIGGNGFFRSLIRCVAKCMLRHYTLKYGIQIPSSTKIGYGLYIGHGVGIVINGGTVIGNNCNISQFLSIGSNKGTPAVIGDCVYIGPSVCIVEDVHIGDNALIGAGAVVTKSIPANSTAVGSPAKIIGENKHPEYIGRKWEIA